MTHPLAGKTREELVKIAQDLNIKVHHKARPETIINQITEYAQPKRDKMQHVAATPVAPVYNNTPEDIRTACQAFIDKGVEVTFPDDGTWIAKYKGAEESGNCAIPLRVIKMKIQSVAQGKRGLPNMGRDGTYGNSYADTILM
jgi:hypothetical protein